jgi:hypothetical protein
MNVSRSACHCLVRRTITELDSPAAEPKNSSSAGTKSPEDIPCRYINGSTSATLGLLRHHGGTIADRNRARSPVSASTRRSSTLGAWISTGPAPVVTDQGSACPLRTTSRRPRSSRSAAWASMYASTSASNAAASMRRAPSNTIASNTDPCSRVGSSVTTLNIGVPSSPALQRRQSSFGSTRKVRRALEQVADPQLQVIPRRPPAQGGCRHAIPIRSKL